MDSSSSNPRSTSPRSGPIISADSKQGEVPVGRPQPVRLTEEEKAVLLECRRNSIARGLPLGVASVVTLRWLVTNGRVPAHVQRWSWFYYTGAFIGTFVMGVASYRQTCFDKIMALDNSFLADQVREHFEGIRRPNYDRYDGGPGAANNSETRRPQYHRHQQQEQRTYPPPSQYRQPSNPTQTLDVPSTVNSDAYSRDKAALHTKEKPVEQPDAFGSEGAYPQSFNTENRQDDLNSPPKQPKGRTFDEIREEHRRRQLQQNFPRSPPSTTDRRESRVEGDWRQTRNSEHQPGRIKRKNKYGDDVYEE